MRLTILFLMLLVSLPSLAQRNRSKKPVVHKGKIILPADLHASIRPGQVNTIEMPADHPDTPLIFHCFFEPMPAFPGDLPAFISSNLHYPDSAMANGIEGRVVIQFLVYKDGSVDCAQVLRTAGNKELDAEALRLISIMPRWIPAKNNSKQVDVLFTMPITFKLD